MNFLVRRASPDDSRALIVDNSRGPNVSVLCTLQAFAGSWEYDRNAGTSGGDEPVTFTKVLKPGEIWQVKPTKFTTQGGQDVATLWVQLQATGHL